mmetsp:Transcript_9168/g.16002  ORF Transcript_9168/g.16002 Transcript_9168/m.16002 type:complete len:182 (-) Transcript_9168:127-672(-)|eukprot:CAMPEP_0184691748 /NCGR_PEP_ID=MMETSP0313-20130426/495_1 /TAXON_ID=2792 /ORGANISM="Porphyridium aerugineum, Strain SAG 1380-2" /LENGTH=181 /DNA_ID=CAMNT_0027149507 /DNA_START=99 /DNA_END=644 /DNA_ORIENTATION=+
MAGFISSVSYSGLAIASRPASVCPALRLQARHVSKPRAALMMNAASSTSTALETETSTEAGAHLEDTFVTVSDAALEQLSKILNSSQEVSVLRVGVKSGGCSGLSFTMDFDKESSVTDEDTCVEFAVGTAGQKVKIVSDPKSLLYLFGMKLDYSPALIGGGFKFSQPNATANCGCGQSFAM